MYPMIIKQSNAHAISKRQGLTPLVYELESAETIPAPAALLHQIYASVGLAYKKSRKHVQRTVKALDYEEVYFALPKKLPHLEKLLEHIDGFLSGK